jgi:hypothetical protein
MLLKRYAICIAMLAFYISEVKSELIQIEAEDGLSMGSRKDRSAASGKATIQLSASQSVTNSFVTRSLCSVEIYDVAYTNDGGSDTIEVYIDDIQIASFTTISASNFGQNWNVIRNTRAIGTSKEIDTGKHELVLKAVNTDAYGVELDKSVLNLTCTSSIQPRSRAKCINVSSLTDELSCDELPQAVRKSKNTNCAEEDNVNIPIYYSGVRSFKVTAVLPQYYPSITTTNNRKENFTNCEFASKNIWKIGEKDNSSSEFAISCAADVYTIGEPISTFCREFENKFHDRKYTITFTAKGIASGLVEASIGSVFIVSLTQVTGSLALEARCFGRDKIWLSLGIATFNSGELTKMWHVPDLTWDEGENANKIELKIANKSSTNASGLFDYLELNKRDENGESAPITVFDNGATIIEAITIDFWWLYPKSMTVKNLNSDQEWYNISYFRIYRKIPGINSYSQLFVLYQDGNSRILPFPPTGIDWIPFGSSVIIGPTAGSSVRPYASITRVNIDVLSLKMELHYESGGKATATLEYTTTSTAVNIDDISFTTTPSIPFTTFRSMWVADGNADVDHVQTSESSWHIQHGWQSLSASSFKFYRSCVSSHNTLSPDILIAVECKTARTSRASESVFASEMAVTISGFLLLHLIIPCLYA